ATRQEVNGKNGTNEIPGRHNARARARDPVPACPVEVRPAGFQGGLEDEPGTGAAVRPVSTQGAAEGVPEQAGGRAEQRRRRQEPTRGAPRVLRVLRLALVGPRPLDAGAAAATVSGPAREKADPRDPGSASDGEESSGRGRLLCPTQLAV